MDRRTAIALLVAVVGVLAIALAAATLTSTVVPSTGGDGGPGEGDGSGPGIEPPPDVDRPIEVLQHPLLDTLFRLLVLLTVIAGLVYVYFHWREVFPVLVSVLALVGLVWLLAQFGPGPMEPYLPAVNASEISASEGGGETGATAPVAVPGIVWLLVGVAVVGAVLLIAQPSLDRESPEAAADEGDTDGTAAIGRAAGRAAERIEAQGNDDYDNEIYRAWKEMTALLDVSNPETMAAGEFAAAAIEAGMAAEDVRELTRLFEAVRYGGDRPTSETERRAIRVFRRIESAYGPEAS